VDVWGTGRLEARKPDKSKHRYHALRGKRTAHTITNHNINTFGDPGLLADCLIRNNPNKSHTLGVVPHYSERDHPATKALMARLPNAIFIDVFEEPLTVIKQIASCHFVISSSLHGLVVADSLNIPNLWLQITGKLRGKNWKFADYYSAFDLESNSPIPVSTIHSFKTIEAKFENYVRPGLQNIKEQLVRTFPY
jgi:hypothetical protein